MEVKQITQEETPQTQPSNLPKVLLMGSKYFPLTYYQNFWCPRLLTTSGLTTFQTHFRARDSDLLIASAPKTGTTWLKALLFATINRITTSNNQTNIQDGSDQSQPNLQTYNPHSLVPLLEIGVYGDFTSYPRPHELDGMPSPRLFHSHLPYFALGESITSSSCKILYIARNPLDVLVSQWHFYPKLINNMSSGEEFKAPSIEEYMEEFNKGTIPYGPYFDHALGYWKLSLERPDKVLFLKYEELKMNGSFHLKRLADFVGFPFSVEEEKSGVIEDIIQLCNIKNLKELEVNKSGFSFDIFENKSFFRKGEVGDWTNHLNPDMVEKMNKVMEEKFKDSGLSFILSK